MVENGGKELPNQYQDLSLLEGCRPLVASLPTFGLVGHCCLDPFLVATPILPLQNPFVQLTDVWGIAIPKVPFWGRRGIVRHPPSDSKYLDGQTRILVGATYSPRILKSQK